MRGILAIRVGLAEEWGREHSVPASATAHYIQVDVTTQEQELGGGGVSAFASGRWVTMELEVLWFPPPLQTAFSSEVPSGQDSMGTEATRPGASSWHTTLCPRIPALSLVVHVPASHLRLPSGT